MAQKKRKNAVQEGGTNLTRAATTCCSVQSKNPCEQEGDQPQKANEQRLRHCPLTDTARQLRYRLITPPSIGAGQRA